MEEDRLLVKLRLGKRGTLVATLLDTGAEINVMRPEVARKLGLRQSRTHPIRALPFNGGDGQMVDKVVHCRVMFGHRSEDCEFYVSKG